jgi:predicted ATPase
MFSDLVGSTALSARMDPEDLREVISAYQKCVAETVERFGGFVAKYMGDGVLIYFGLALYNPAEHRSLVTRFQQDVRVVVLSFRSFALWMLGFPEAALADADQALIDAREIGQAATLMFALTTATTALCGNYATAARRIGELVALADEKRAFYWRAVGMTMQGILFALTGRASDAVQTINAGIAALRSTGASLFMSSWLSYLAKAYAEVGQFDYAWRCIGEAITIIETTKERWWEAEVNRIAGEIALMSPKPDETKAQRYFERAIAVARQQQAKSWELRAVMSLARLWRDQGKVQQARELLAPIYGWFTEGFDTRDLKEAKVLLEELECPGPFIARGEAPTSTTKGD